MSDIYASDSATVSVQTTVIGSNETFMDLEKENIYINPSEPLYQKACNDTIGNVDKKTSLGEQMEFTSDSTITHFGMYENQEKDTVKHKTFESDSVSHFTNTDTETLDSTGQSAFESKDKNELMDTKDFCNLQTEKPYLSIEYDGTEPLMKEEMDSDKQLDETVSSQVSQLPILHSHEDESTELKVDYDVETRDKDEQDGSAVKVTDTDPQGKSHDLPCAFGHGISESELSDVLDKLINDQDVIENVSPVVSDFEKENEGNGIEYQNESSNLPREMSDDSESGSEDNCSSIDSDISGDEEVCGTWNPSPLYSYDVEDYDEGEIEAADSSPEAMRNEILSDSVNKGVNHTLFMSEADDSKILDENKVCTQRENVNELMEELESLVQQGQLDECASAIKTPPLQEDRSNIEVVGTVTTIQSSFKSDRGKKLCSSSNENESHRVHFQSPTNMLFYDPESPIIEKVSTEVQNELIDYDDEAKDFENEKEMSGSVSTSELQAEVVKDLKEVYEKFEVEDEPSETNKKSEDDVAIKLNDDKSQEKGVDISNFSLYKRKIDTEEEEEQVVLRKKNNRNSDASSHRSNVLSESECDSMVINQLEMFIPPKAEGFLVEEEMEFSRSNTEQQTMPGISDKTAETESVENPDMISSTESIIIHDDEDNSLESCKKGTNNLESLPTDDSSDSFGSFVPTTDGKLEFIKEMKVSGTEELKDRNEYTGNLSEESNFDISEKYVNNTEFEDIEDISPFDMSQNDTVVEAETEGSEDQNFTHTTSGVSGEISGNSCLESDSIKTVIDESRTMIQSGNKMNTGESLVENTDVNSDNHMDSSKETEKTAHQEKFMEMIQQFLKQGILPAKICI